MSNLIVVPKLMCHVLFTTLLLYSETYLVLWHLAHTSVLFNTPVLCAHFGAVQYYGIVRTLRCCSILRYCAHTSVLFNTPVLCAHFGAVQYSGIVRTLRCCSILRYCAHTSVLFNTPVLCAHFGVNTSSVRRACICKWTILYIYPYLYIYCNTI